MRKNVKGSWTQSPNHYSICPTCNHYGVVHNKHEPKKCLYCGKVFDKKRGELK